MRRVVTPSTDAQYRERLLAFRKLAGPGPHKAAHLAGIIWPGAKRYKAQGAGAAASRVLKRLGCTWTVTTGHRMNKDWGWLLTGL